MRFIKLAHIVTVILFCYTTGYPQKKYVKELNQILETKFNFKNLTNTIPIIHNSDTLAYIFNYDKGYIVLSNQTWLYPLKAYSLEQHLDTNSQSFFLFVSLLKSDYALQHNLLYTNPKLAQKNKEAWSEWLQDKIKFKQTVGPLLKSEYGQVNCKDENGNYIYVTNYYTPNHYAVGCVALVMATTMRYYNWPPKGKGSFTYTDNYGNSTGTYSADFENTTYQWQLIQDKYYKVSSSDESRRALGRIAFDAAVALEMDFEAGGSTSNINRIPGVVNKYFRYERPEYLTISNENFWNKVDSSLLARSPVEFAVYTEDGMGHAIVCDGVQQTSDPSTQLYHLNMGWWGASNGWYTIQSDFNAGGYTIITAAVMGLIPVPMLSEPTYNIQDNTISISWYYSPTITDARFEVQAKKGDLDDWQTVGENITDNQYSFKADTNYKYYIRVKESRNKIWSEEITIDPSYYISVLNKAQIYPSYIYDHFYIQYADLQNSTLYIYNQRGSLIKTQKLSGSIKQRIELNNFTPGLYYIKLVSPDNQFGFKIIILGDNPLY